MKTKLESAAVWMPIGNLFAWEDNPRENSEAIPEVANSIKRFGFASPIIARQTDDDRYEIIAGHTRHQAALSLKLDRVPVRVMDLDPTDAKLLAIADNRMSELAEWSDGLSSVLAELEAEGADLTVLGWGDDLPQFEQEPMYSLLDDEEDDDFLAELEAGVRKAIQIEFEPDDYEVAQQLCAFWRQQGAYLGGMIIEFLQDAQVKNEAQAV
tara:strand:- start:72 stop:704 length:633 start_codon:yes stop_codon:yes gene_type:complete